VRRHILEPLGMRRSTFENPGAAGIAGATELYDVRHLPGGGEEVFPSPGWSDAPAMVGAGWLRSTASDLLRYLGMYLGRGELEGERVLSADGIAKMLRSRVETAPGRYYAYGFAVVRDFYGHDMIGHSGGLKGVGADVGFVPDLGLAGAALANLMGPAARQTVQGGLAFALDGLARPFHHAYPDYAVRAERLAGCLGTFPSGEGDTYHIEARDGRLRISDGHSSSDLRPVGEDAFLAQDREDDTFVRFWRREGDVYAVSVGTRMVLRQPAQG
jgi:CubicO group peptidase (beta-lactamase class C family)